MNELFDCNKLMKIPFDTLWKMRTRDRRFLIARHNKDTQEENDKENGMGSTSTTDIDRFTDLELMNSKNRMK